MNLVKLPVFPRYSTTINRKDTFFRVKGECLIGMGRRGSWVVGPYP